MTDATELDEAGIRARLEAAAPAPWTARHNYVDDDLNEYRDSDICFHPTAKVFNGVPQVLGYVDLAEEDAEFIAHARTDVGLLLTALDEARADRLCSCGYGVVCGQCKRALLARAEAAEGALAAVERERDQWRAVAEERTTVRYRNAEQMDAALAAVRALADEERLVSTSELRAALALATPTTTEETPTRAEALVEGIERLIEQCEGRPQVTHRLPAALRLLLNTYRRPPTKEGN